MGGVLHAGVHCFLEGFDLGVGLSPICLSGVSGYGELPSLWGELTSYPREKWVNPARSERPETHTANWGTTKTGSRLEFSLRR